MTFIAAPTCRDSRSLRYHNAIYANTSSSCEERAAEYRLNGLIVCRRFGGQCTPCNYRQRHHNSRSAFREQDRATHSTCATVYGTYAVWSRFHIRSLTRRATPGRYICQEKIEDTLFCRQSSQLGRLGKIRCTNIEQIDPADTLLDECRCSKPSCRGSNTIRMPYLEPLILL